MEFAFNIEVLEAHRELKMTADFKNFYAELCEDMKEQGNIYWLILRTSFNHLMFIFSSKPYLLLGFETFLVNFLVCREVRNLDAEI
jgi:hypothetical protein